MVSIRVLSSSLFFFFNDTATTEIYTLSLHDALPISGGSDADTGGAASWDPDPRRRRWSSASPLAAPPDRKSTRLNSSHVAISYAVFCLKKKMKAYIVRLEKMEINHTKPMSHEPLAAL